MCTDRVVMIRQRIENLLKDIDLKYAGMVAGKAMSGLKEAYRLQTFFRADATDIIRGVRTTDARPKNDLPSMSNDVQSVLNGLYLCIRTNRQQRRNFLNQTIRLLSDKEAEVGTILFSHQNKRANLQNYTLHELIFIADNLAHFPYQHLDEPLYVIFTANQMISVYGQNIIGRFNALQSTQYVSGEEDENLSANVIYCTISALISTNKMRFSIFSSNARR